jgi:hypothetical protein
VQEVSLIDVLIAGGWMDGMLTFMQGVVRLRQTQTPAKL